MEIGLHESINTIDTITHVTVRASLLTIAPYLYRIFLSNKGNLATNRSRRFFASPIIRSQGAEDAEDIVETDYVGLETIILTVMPALP